MKRKFCNPTIPQFRNPAILQSRCFCLYAVFLRMNFAVNYRTGFLLNYVTDLFGNAFSTKTVAQNCPYGRGIARLNRVYYETCERLFLEDKYARFQKTYGVCFDGSIDI